MQTCNICNESLTEEISVNDQGQLLIECHRCGKYKIDENEYNALKNVNVHHMFSSKLRMIYNTLLAMDNYTKKNPEEQEDMILEQMKSFTTSKAVWLNRKLIEELHMTQDKSIKEKYFLFLKYLYDNVKFEKFEIPILFAQELIALSWCENVKEFQILTNKALKEEHIVITNEEENKQKFSISFDGIAFIQEEAEENSKNL